MDTYRHFSALNLCRNVHIFGIVLPNRPEPFHPSCVSALFLPLRNTYSKPTDLRHSGSSQRQQTDKNNVCPATVGEPRTQLHLIISYHELETNSFSCGKGKHSYKAANRDLHTHTRRETNTHIPNIIVRVCPSPSQSEAPAFTEKGNYRVSEREDATISGSDQRGQERSVASLLASRRLQGGAPFTVQTTSVSRYQQLPWEGNSSQGAWTVVQGWEMDINWVKSALRGSGDSTNPPPSSRVEVERGGRRPVTCRTTSPLCTYTRFLSCLSHSMKPR